MRVNRWVVVVATGISVLFARALFGQQPAPPDQDWPALFKAKPLKPDAKDDELRKLQKARYNEAVAEMEARYRELVAGKTNIADAADDIAQRLVESGLEVYEQPAERVRLLEQYLEVAKDVERIAEARHEAGVLSAADLHRMRYARIDAEIRLLKARRDADKKKR